MANILEIKRIPTQKNPNIIGNYPVGGIVEIEKKICWLRHQSFRWNGQGWGWENDGFSQNDLSEVGYHLTPLDRKITLESAKEQLNLLKEGILPSDFTIGVEIEGCLYDFNGNLIPKHNNLLSLENDSHPELMCFTVETVTKPKKNGHLQSPVEIAHALAEAVLEGCQIAHNRGGLIVYSSVPEHGKLDQAQITPHPYLLAFAPKVLAFTINNWEKIPQEAKQLYRLLGIEIYDYLRQTGILNWPINALHVHSGVSQINNLADPRVAYSYGVIRLTIFSKVVSLMLYNTSYFYGVDTGYKDVRSICRRLLATTIDSSIPENAEKLITEMVNQLAQGQIHSPSRFPATGQHDRVRFRAEGQYKTVESIDAPMTPDLRSVLGWIFFNQILNVIALEAIVNTEGDESTVIDHLKQKCGIFATIPALGKESSWAVDLVFNQHGFDGVFGQTTLKDHLLNVKNIIEDYGSRYPAVNLQSRVVSHLIDLSLAEPNNSLSSRLGIYSGKFIPDTQYTGIVTEAKRRCSPQELLEIQSQATYQQACWLLNVSDNNHLLNFFGL